MEWKHKKVTCKLMLEGNGNQITFHSLFVIFSEKRKEAEVGWRNLNVFLVEFGQAGYWLLATGRREKRDVKKVPAA
jgi:hypothetical protein